MLSKTEWKADEECNACEECQAEFSFFRRRHHCRRCGGLFCSKCSQERMKGLPGYGDEPQRICGACKSAVAAIMEVGKMRPRERRIYILGSDGVGKSALFHQMCVDKGASGDAKQTFMGPNAAKTRPMRFRGSEYLFNVVDSVGQNGYELFQPQYTIGTHAYLLVFNFMDRSSYAIIPTIRERIIECGGKEKVIVLIGNRGESGFAERQVSAEEAQRLAKSWNSQYVEISAKKQRTVDEMMSGVLLKRIVEQEQV